MEKPASEAHVRSGHSMIHDFRRSMATTLADSGLDQFDIKYALNHKDSSVPGVYSKSHHIKRKALALATWYDLVSVSITAKVHHLRKA